jgi:putative FmdB family regulatory protein
MPIYDYECQSCGHIAEQIRPADEDQLIECPNCWQTAARRIISCGNSAYLGNQDAPWLKSVVEVVGTETAAGRTFIANPTRDNYRAWMRAKGTRPLEPGERGGKPPRQLDEARITRKLFERHRRRNRIEVQS